MKSLILFLSAVWISSVSGYKSKKFEKKYIESSSFEGTETKVLHVSSGKMDKIICSSFCLNHNTEDCDAFHINANQCVMIQNPELLQAARGDYLDAFTPMIWTAKNPQPAFTEYVLVVGGWSSQGQIAAEIPDLGYKNFECIKSLPNFNDNSKIIEFMVAGVIGNIPFICGGEKSGFRRIGQSCSILENKEFIKVDGYGGTYGGGRTRAGSGSVVLNGKLLSSGGFQKGSGFVDENNSNVHKIEHYRDTFLISFDGITKLNLKSPVDNFHCIIKINETTVLSTGGVIQGSNGAVAQTWWQNVESLETRNGPKLNHGRSTHGCANIKINY